MPITAMRKRTTRIRANPARFDQIQVRIKPVMVNNPSPHVKPREMAAKEGTEPRKIGETLKTAAAAIAP